MSPTTQRKPWLFGGLLALVVALALAGIYLFSGGTAVYQELEARTFEWRLQLRGARPAPEEVAILAIDNETLDSPQILRWPLRRSMLARTLMAAKEAGAKTVGINILLVDPEPPSDGVTLSSGDRELYDSLREIGDVILGMALMFEAAAAPEPADISSLSRMAYALVLSPPTGALRPPEAEGVLMPLRPFRQQSTLGHVNLLLSEGGAAVNQQTAVALPPFYMPSFPAVMAAHWLDVPYDALGVALDGSLLLGGRNVPLDITLSLPINPYGGEGGIDTYSLIDLLDGKLPPEALRGRAVVIGATAVGVGERFHTAFDGNLPGVEILATATANLIDQSYIVRTAETRLGDSLAILLLGLLAWGLGRFLGLRGALLACSLLLLAWWGAAYLALSMLQIWLAVMAQTTVVVLCGTIGMVGRAARERRQRAEAERQRGNLARYVSPLMAERLAAEERPDFDRRHQEASILFIDLGGFTSESEGRSPGETVEFLVDYHQRLERVVLAHGGVIEQFQGDGAMVIFGLPEPRDDDAVRALASARELIAVLFDWRPDIRVRAGLHHGPVAIARLGGDRQAQLAAAGDTVNVASRLEHLAKEEEASLVVSEDLAAMVEAAGRDDLLAGLERQAAREIRGRKQAMALRLGRLDRLVSIEG